jgi:hypothetical protein
VLNLAPLAVACVGPHLPWRDRHVAHVVISFRRWVSGAPRCAATRHRVEQKRASDRREMKLYPQLEHQLVCWRFWCVLLARRLR